MMRRINLTIEGIPAVRWGEPSDKLFLAIHGARGSKDDAGIITFAEEAGLKGYQILSFDLPEHGDRKGEDYPCIVQNGVRDLTVIGAYAHTISTQLKLFACSVGAYFSLLAYRDWPLEQCLFLSPIVDMQRIIQNMMGRFNVSEDRLRREKEIETPIGRTLDWDYYGYVKSHPIDAWDKPTAILYGSDDDTSESQVVSEFAERYHCRLRVLEHGEHYFHTDEQLQYFRRWLRESILPALEVMG
jgi:uncharacterized protein